MVFKTIQNLTSWLLMIVNDEYFILMIYSKCRKHSNVDTYLNLFSLK